MKITNLTLMSIGIWLLAGVGMLAQNAPPEKKTSDLEGSAIEMLTRQGIFKRSSSTEPDADEGFRIVAVRRVSMILNDASGQQLRKKDLVEIELYASVMPLPTGLREVIQIGAKSFSLGKVRGLPCDNNENCIQVVMTPEQFDELSDNSLVTLYKGSPMSPEILTELYKDGEPREVFGAKFGRLNKKMIDEFTPVVLVRTRP